MPDKFHGVADQEVKYRQRYVDLMTDEDARKRFIARSKAIAGLREFMVAHDFLEVETPMLHPIPGGARVLRGRGFTSGLQSSGSAPSARRLLVQSEWSQIWNW